METWNNYTINSYKFIVWFYRLLLLFVLLMVVLLFVLRINETVPIKEGQIVAVNPQTDYVAPVDAETIKINVQEGQQVKLGDTLMELQVENAVQQENTDSSLHVLDIIARKSGTVNFVFTSDRSSNLVHKGDVLVSIAPLINKYFARVAVAEKDLSRIHKGLPVQLKMNAYRNEDDRLTGTVLFVSEQKQGDHFFALIDISKENKLPLRAGYAVHGDVVLQQLPLYKFFLKKLFHTE